MFSFSKAGRDMIGFNPIWILLIGCVITGITFPMVFLGDTLANYLRFWLMNSVFGFIYAGILTFGNVYIFFKCKENSSKREMTRNTKRFFQVALYHLIFTAIVSTILGILSSFGTQSELTGEVLLRNVIGSILFATIFILFFEFVYYMHALNNAEKKHEQLKRENAESQLEILKNQIKPHFLFNSLNTLISLIPENPDEAISYVQRLSTVYRYILEIKDKKLIPLHEELKCVINYVEMLQIRFGEKLIFDVDKSTFDKSDHIVPLSLQLLIENAVKHNIVSDKRPLSIKIKKGKNNKLIISNNLQMKMQKMPSTGTGLANIKSRYSLLAHDEVEIIQTADNFSVSLPLILVS